MRQIIKLSATLSAILLSIMLIIPSCKKDDSKPAYQKTWVIDMGIAKACYKFDESGILHAGVCIDEEMITNIHGMPTDDLSQEDKNFINNLKIGEYICMTGVYVVLPGSNDNEGTFVCTSEGITTTIQYKMLSSTSIQLISKKEEQNLICTAMDVTVKDIPKSLSELYNYILK